MGEQKIAAVNPFPSLLLWMVSHTLPINPLMKLPQNGTLGSISSLATNLKETLWVPYE